MVHHPILLETRPSLQLSTAMSNAFRNDPAWTYLIPDETRRLRLLPPFFNIILRYSQRYGELYTTPDEAGAACWLTPGNTTPLLRRLILIGIREARLGLDLGWAGFRRYLAMEECSERLHCQAITNNHWYLWALGVDPAHQKQGLGSLLMQPVLTQADTHHLPCYLETSNEHNIAFYQKHSFRLVGEEVIEKSNVHTWAMLRKPVLLTETNTLDTIYTKEQS